ncbi:hypothetical protein PUN28_006203 [Cardiocondyla obscurior]|uniref:Uncharacterized protein n=1 Tax=Cardiocondyla obscurior TaxID=286306 RepID=A0AAW2G978_9HYME
MAAAELTNGDVRLMSLFRVQRGVCQHLKRSLDSLIVRSRRRCASSRGSMEKKRCDWLTVAKIALLRNHGTRNTARPLFLSLIHFCICVMWRAGR